MSEQVHYILQSCTCSHLKTIPFNHDATQLMAVLVKTFMQNENEDQQKTLKNLNTARRQTLTRLVVFLAASPVMSRPLSVRSISRSLVPWFCGLVFLSSSLSSLPLSRWTLSYLVAVPLTDWWYCGLSIRILRGTRLRRVVSGIHSFSSAHGSVTRPTTLNLLRLCRCPACCSARPTNSTTFLAKLEL